MAAQNSPPRARVVPWLVAALFALAWALAARQTFQLGLEGGDASRVGDWLINYRGGFVRRGLVGELLLLACAITSLPLLWTILFLQLGLYAALLLVTLKLLWPWLRARPTTVFLALSPCTFLFYALNVMSFRKELLGLLGLALVCWLGPRLRAHRFGLLAAACLLGPLLILSHEGQLLLLPYFCLALGALGTVPRQRRALALLPVLLVGTALVASFARPGDAKVARAVADSLVESVPAASLASARGTGAIGALDHDASDGFRLVRHRLFAPETRYLRRYGFVTWLCALPFVFQVPALRRRFASAESRLALASAMLMTLGLGCIAVDWGRFIHMNTTALALVLLVDPPDPRATTRKLELVWAALGLVYALSWRLPVSTQSQRQGLFHQLRVVGGNT